MNKLLAAIAIATSLTAGAAFAQAEAVEMGEALTMLETATAKGLDRIGVADVDTMSLSLNQLAQIKAILETSDSNTGAQQQQVRAIIAR